ncbi:MAG: hypothetical protein RJA10_904 [Pseudomonadota bacterium]|jgi:hypothetical protein
MVVCLCGCFAPLQAARAAALVTIVDGEAQLLDGNRSLVATEGLKVADETLVRTGPKTTLLRVEWPDGSVADFGPDTQAMLNPGGFGLRGGRTPAVYLLRGWLKLSAMGTGPAAGLLAPRLDVLPFKGALVVMALGDETWVFTEGGGAPMVERDLKPASNLTLKSGEVYLRSGNAKGAVSPRPSPAQMQRVPRGFRDSLPLRTAALKDKAVAAKPAPPASYADLRDWLLAEAPLRKSFTRRFAERAKDPAFRAGLNENLARHPEWEPVLFPERFTKSASAPAR